MSRQRDATERSRVPDAAAFEQYLPATPSLSKPGVVERVVTALFRRRGPVRVRRK
ncbi:hypothetical protein [Halobacterium yunchengense]|uniref:hypothetical protein n=1 Tax=Halobacterium yunchengense TaxID=3108497 RepID=UPI00300B7AF3